MKRFFVGLFILAAVSPVAAQQTPTERTVVVNASATVEREPERAVIMLAVESTGTTARQAAQANATRMDAVIAALRRLGLTGGAVRTVSYELQPEYARDRERVEPADRNAPPRIVGYRAINMVQVTVDTVARAGGVIDAALQAGANRVANLSFELRDELAARLESLRLAVSRARSEAEAMAQAAGNRLGPALNITTGGYAIPRYGRAAAMDMAMQAPAPPTPIEGGMLSITAHVTVTFRLEN